MSRKSTLLIITILLLTMFAACSRINIKFQIEFESNGGTPCRTVKSENVETIKMPNSPKKEGFSFQGWYWDDGVWNKPFTINSILDQPLSDYLNLKVYAKWLSDDINTEDTEDTDEKESPDEKTPFILNFESNGGTAVSSITSEAILTGAASVSVSDKINFVFKGWFWDNNTFNKPFTLNSIYDRPLTEFPDLKVFAKWKGVDCTINLNTNGGNANVLKKTVEYMTKQFSLPIPAKSDYTFDGWFLDERFTVRLTDKYGFNAETVWEYSSETTVFAKWSPKAYAVNLHAQDGIVEGYDKEYASLIAYKNQVVVLPDAERAGYSFEGWFNSNSGGDKINSPYLFTDNLDLYLVARWQAKTYTVSYNSNGGTSIESRQVVFGEPYSYFPLVEKYAHIFIGWKLNGESIGNIQEYKFTHDITLTAEWEIYKHSHLVTFDAQGGIILSQTSVYNKPEEHSFFQKTYLNRDVFINNAESNQYFVISAHKNYYSFIGWFTQPNGKGEQFTQSTVINETMPENFTLYAYYKMFRNIVFVANDDGLPGDAVLIGQEGSFSFNNNPVYSKPYYIDEKLMNTEAGDGYFFIVGYKKDYIFQGWYTKPNGQGIQFDNDMLITEDLNENIVLYAYYIPC